MKASEKMILDAVRLSHGMDQVIVGFSRYGFGSQLSFAIYQAYKNEALEIIQENPYQLVEDIEGVGFKRADNIADQLGIEATSPQRYRAAVLHQIFSQSLQTGNTYIHAQRFAREQTLRLLKQVDPSKFHRMTWQIRLLDVVEEGKINKKKRSCMKTVSIFQSGGIANSIQLDY